MDDLSLTTRDEVGEILIYKVEEKRLLYDTSSVNYRNLEAKERAWKEIATEMGLKVNECRQLWKNLRGSYLKAYRKRLLTKNAKLKWKFEDQMSFLNPFLSPFRNHPKFVQMPTVEDINYLINEAVEKPQDANFNMNITNEEEMEINLTNDSNSQDYLDPLALTPELSMNNTNSNSCKVNDKIESSGYHDDISVKKPIDQSDKYSKINSTVRNRKFQNNEFIKSSFLGDDFSECINESRLEADRSCFNSVFTLVIKKPMKLNTISEEPNCSSEEEFYLRLAKMACTLEPAERMKVREVVSRIVIDALLPSFPEE